MNTAHWRREGGPLYIKPDEQFVPMLRSKIAATADYSAKISCNGRGSVDSSCLHGSLD